MFSREGSQKIDYVLEIYHHCFSFNKVGKAKKKKKEMPMLLFSPVPPVSSDLLRSRD